MKKIFVFLTMCCLMLGAFAQTVPVAKAVKNPGDTIDCISFKSAVDTLNKYNGGTILVCADDSIADQINIEKPMTIRAFGGNYTIKVANSFNAGYAFFIYKDLTLGEEDAEYTLTFDGNQKTPSGAFFYCSNPSTDNPSLTLEDGVHITKCSSTVACMSSRCNLNIIGDVLVDECMCDHLFYTWFPNMLTMTNGKIENNTVTTCIFEIKGDAQLSGGAIQNNTYTGANASAIISYYSHLDVYTDNSNVKLQDSIFIGDTVRLIAGNTGNNFRDQVETGNDLTKHSADNPIVVKVNYTEDRQILTGVEANILANYTKFKPVDVNGKNVCIDKNGWLREYKFFSIATGATDTVGHFTLKAAVDTLNNHGGGKVLADYGEVLTETVNVNSDIQILARGADVTFTRGESLRTAPIIEIENNGTLTLNALDAPDSLIFDGGNFPDHCPSPIIENKGTVNLLDNVILCNNRNSTYTGGAVYNYDANSVLNVAGKATIMDNESSQGGAICCMKGTVNISGPATIKGNKANTGAAVYVANDGNNAFTMSNGLITENILEVNSNTTGGVLYLGTLSQYNSLTGGTITNNVITMDSSYTPTSHTLPADVRILAKSILNMGDSVIVDSIGLNLANVAAYQKQQINLTANLTKVTEANPIVLTIDSLDKQVLTAATTGTTLIADNYMKFKPSSDTLSINRKGWVVRKPQISVDGIYLLQKGTRYEDYGITTNDSEVDVDKIYVEYTQNVDAHGSTNLTTSDSTIIEMNVTYGDANSKVRQKIDAQENGQYVFTIPFNSNLWDVKPSNGVLTSGNYKVEIDTLIVYTLGIAAGTEETLEKDVNIPTFTIDTLNFLLAGMKFSDYGHCGVGATTNDGDGNDVVPGDEIYVQYQREGAIDTAYITVEVTGNGQTVTYEEGTPANTHLEAGCGSFRSFLDNTGIGQFEPNALQLVDDSIYTCQVSIHVKAEGDPYFATASKTFTYKHDIDRSATFALDTANDRDENYHKIGIALNNINDSLALTYPSVFSVAKANELGMIDNTDHCVYVVLTADPVDTVLRVESANQAKNLLTDVALNSSNYFTAGYGVQDGKLLMAVKVSEPVAENAVVVPAINFAMDSVLRWCSVIGANTGVNNPYHTYRTYYKVSGETAHDTTLVAYNQMSYRKTGVSGVKLHATDGQASYIFHPEDYTVWNTQNPTSGLNLDGKVWLALYVAAPNENVKQVYSHPATNTPSGEISSIVTLADNLEKRVTATEAVNYYPVGTCADYNTKDYTFYSTGDAPYLNNYLYWFDENSKLLSVQRFNAAVKAAPIYSVNFNFNGGGATCDQPYSSDFADTTYIFGRPIVRPDDPFKCGNLFMDWRHGVDSFTVDSFKNIRAGIAEATGATVENQQFGIRSNMVINAAWKYFVTLHNPHDTAVVADYSLCEINTRDYVWEPTEATFPYVYEFHTDYLDHYYRDYPENTTNCDVKFEANAFTEIPAVLPVGQTSLLSWNVTDLCGRQFTISQKVNVKFPPCGTDNYNPHLFPFTQYDDSTYKAIDFENNLYETVRVGCDCWTKENLKSLHYTDGTEIPVAQAYLNKEENVDEFGRLYTWYSAVRLPENSNEVTVPLNADHMPQGVCPNGWYLPADEDFTRMSNLENIQGASVGVKTDGSNAYWLGHLYGDNSTGFSAKPAGFYNTQTERYYNLIGDAYFWSSSSTTTASAPCCVLTHSCPNILILDNNKWYGYSVRCIKYKKFDY